LQRIHRKGQALPPSQEYQGKEIDNIVEACNVISKQMINDEQDCDITPERIASFNAMVLKDLPLEEGVVPGQLRQYSVGVGDYRGAPFEDCEYLLRRLCDWINHIKQEENKVPIAVLRAVLAHLYLAWIHPFGDGNGRTARLIEFQILLGVGMPTVACHLLSNHYNKTRSEYYRQLSLASKTRDVFPFIRYAVQGLVDQLDSQIRKIREYQHSVVWKDYVYDRFRDKKTPAAHRQRQLALELGMRREPDSPRSITSIPEMGNAYSGKTRKTITRDIHELERLGLTIRVGARSFKANTAALRAFRPARRNAAKRQ
jgi:Fic family protein